MKPARCTVCNRSARSNARAATKANGVCPSWLAPELIARHHLELDLQCSCQQRAHNVRIWHFTCKPVQGSSFGLARQIKHLDLVLMPCESGLDRHAVMNPKVVKVLISVELLPANSAVIFHSCILTYCLFHLLFCFIYCIFNLLKMYINLY